jgi:hypothetical protein
VRDPLPAGTLALLALGAGHRAGHAGLYARRRADGDVRLHAALPEGEATVAIRRVHGAAHAIFVDSHVAERHRDRVDVRVHDRRIP